MYRLMQLHEQNERTLMREAPDTVLCVCGSWTKPNKARKHISVQFFRWEEYNTHKDVNFVYWHCKECQNLNVYGTGFSLDETSTLARAELAQNAEKAAKIHGNFASGITINRTWLHQVPGIFQI